MAKPVKRVELRIDPDLYDQVKHFADKDSLSVNAWIEMSCQHYIDWINADYDVPTAMTQRVNQLVSITNGMSENQKELTQVIVNGFSAMTEIMHGKSYLASDISEDDNSNNNNNK